MAAINKIEYTSLLVEEVKSTLNELIGDRAKLLGIVKDSTQDGYYEPTGQNVPKKIVDFLIFFKLAVILAKLSIAKHDEKTIIGQMEKGR